MHRNFRGGKRFHHGPCDLCHTLELHGNDIVSAPVAAIKSGKLLKGLQVTAESQLHPVFRRQFLIDMVLPDLRK
ncbi:hypothetical protein SDC9_208328 [bioreactor metagenome]|uniref:Uncharacterized protein n=1 Tax=bioreactor metagenome TaxID=1076179 RepID=A0A645JD57_9ZZZZ